MNFIEAMKAMRDGEHVNCWYQYPIFYAGDRFWHDGPESAGFFPDHRDVLTTRWYVASEEECLNGRTAPILTGANRE